MNKQTSVERLKRYRSGESIPGIYDHPDRQTSYEKLIAEDLQNTADAYFAIEDAFGPVKDWYEGDGDRTLVEMVADAIADLQEDRKLAIKYHQLCKAKIE